jgi:RNA polymerase sigma factor (sigma-70 family)
LAEEVSQSVFTQLARHVAGLKQGTILTAWLHQVTYHAAIDVVRREARRQAREKIACEMSLLMDDDASAGTQIEPHLDEAVHSLDEADRAAILLRFFENKSLREVGETLGASEDAAQKRISRALDRLRDYFVKNKIAAPTGSLAGIISAHVIQAAPVGLSSVIASASLSTAATLSASATLTAAKIIAMTTLQKIAVGVLLVGAVVTIAYQQHEVSNLRQETAGIAQQQAQEKTLTAQIQQLQQERDQATYELASIKEENATLKKRPTEVLKLRGEVGTLRDEKAQLGATTAISKMTATPEARQLLHDQQKMGMGVIYKDFAKQMKLDSAQTEKLNDVLADYVLKNVDQITDAIRDKIPADQLRQMFAGQDATLDQNIQDTLGADAVAQYHDYNKNLLSTLTSEQFEDSLSGSADEKKAKMDQLRQSIQQAEQAALSGAGLPSDYQTIPVLNFANFVSEQQANDNLKLLQGIYQHVTDGASSYMTPDELTKFQAFVKKAIANNTAAINMNRALMSPISNQ